MTHTLVDDPGQSWNDSGELQGQTLAGEIDQASAKKGTLVDDPGGIWNDSHLRWASCKDRRLHGSLLIIHTNDPARCMQGQKLAGEIDRANARQGNLVDDTSGSWKD